MSVCRRVDPLRLNEVVDVDATMPGQVGGEAAEDTALEEVQRVGPERQPSVPSGDATDRRLRPGSPDGPGRRSSVGAEEPKTVILEPQHPGRLRRRLHAGT